MPEIEITNINDLGQGYAKFDSKRNIFIQNSVIGDVIDAKITKETIGVGFIGVIHVVIVIVRSTVQVYSSFYQQIPSYSIRFQPMQAYSSLF